MVVFVRGAGLGQNGMGAARVPIADVIRWKAGRWSLEKDPTDRPQTEIRPLGRGCRWGSSLAGCRIYSLHAAGYGYRPGLVACFAG
jgi:hypothetical protein